MKIQALSLNPYEIPLLSGQMRSGALLHITDSKGKCGSGDIAPLPNWSRETLNQSIEQIQKKKEAILAIKWAEKDYLEQLINLKLFPSVSFALESAILSILAPLPNYSIQTSALLMGSPNEILKTAELRKQEGYTSAKLKVGNLTFKEASHLIHQLKDTFSLRLDVNRAWKSKEALDFFSNFALDTFDYVEEPFQNPQELSHFLHPLAIDESFPKDLSLTELELLPTLKALIYKPTIQGGLTECLPLYKWTKEKNINLILSGSFESDTGLSNIASIAYRLSLTSPIGIGTYHFLKEHTLSNSFEILNSVARVKIG